MRAGDGDADRSSGPKSFLNPSNLLGSDGPRTTTKGLLDLQDGVSLDVQ